MQGFLIRIQIVMTQQSMFSDNPDWLDPPGPRSLDYLIQDPHRWIIDFQGALSVATLTDGGIS